MSLKIGEDVRVPFQILAADLIANSGSELIAPIDGYIMQIDATVQTAVTTGGTVSVKTGDALATTVGSLGFTVANSATKGTRFSDQSVPGDNTRFVAKGSRIQIVTASFATAGALVGFLTMNPSGAV